MAWRRTGNQLLPETIVFAERVYPSPGPSELMEYAAHRGPAHIIYRVKHGHATDQHDKCGHNVPKKVLNTSQNMDVFVPLCDWSMLTIWEQISPEKVWNLLLSHQVYILT